MSATNSSSQLPAIRQIDLPHTLFKSAKKNDNKRDALRTHCTQAYWRLDTLHTIINSCYYYI